MRSKRQKLYDKLYFEFENELNITSRKIRTQIRYRNFSFTPEQKQVLENSVRPFWAQYGIKLPDAWAKQMLALTGHLEPGYIPRIIWFNDIIPHFNDMTCERLLQDKNLHRLMFSTAKRPETVFKYMRGTYCNDDFSPISKETAYARCRDEPVHLIVKPTSDTCEGHDIQLLTSSLSDEELDLMFSCYSGTDFIVQKFLTQSPALAAFNPSSINTIRLITLVLNGEAYILSSILRIGKEGNYLDNIAQGGYQCTIRPDGTLEKTAYTSQGGKPAMVKTTAAGVPFEGFVVPAWVELCSLAKTLALQTPYFRLIGWDFAVDAGGDITLIEYNVFPEQNEATCGPTFGDLTDAVLTEVFGKK